MTEPRPPILLPPVLLIGGGKMGGAMLAGWREQGLAPSIVIDPGPNAHALAAPGIQVVPTLDALPPGFAPACVVLAVKPQIAHDVLPGLIRFQAALVVSIMAGRSIVGIAAAIGGTPAIIRAMPNTPAAIRQGITVAHAAPNVTAPQRALADALLAAVGTVAWVDDESHLDAVTAISGGGPAYVFLLAELLEQAGLAQGLPPGLARQMARITVAGSGALLAASPEDAATLRKAVTSPGGTTERALAVLMQPGAWPRTVNDAIEAATTRSRELGA